MTKKFDFGSIWSHNYKTLWEGQGILKKTMCVASFILEKNKKKIALY